MPNLLFLLLFTIYQTPDYKIDLGKYYDKQKQEKAQGYVETFTIKDEAGKEQYVISITKVAMPSGQNVPNVYGAEYKQAILSKCGCTISSASVKQFSHFKAQEFKIIRNGKGTCVYSTTKGNKLFSITYSAIGNRNTEDKYPDFEKVINTLEFL
jgi:hypothetical protein